MTIGYLCAASYIVTVAVYYAERLVEKNTLLIYMAVIHSIFNNCNQDAKRIDNACNFQFK